MLDTGIVKRDTGTTINKEIVMSKTATPSIYMADRPDLLKRLYKLQEEDRLKISTVIKAALDATLADIERNKNKRSCTINGRKVSLV